MRIFRNYISCSVPCPKGHTTGSKILSKNQIMNLIRVKYWCSLCGSRWEEEIVD